MRPYVLRSPAKINLTLDIVGFDEKSGYHQVDTILYKLPDLFDEIRLEEAEELSLRSDGYEVPLGTSNIVIKTLKLLGEKRWKVHLIKRIPPESGLGGGSSNAAAILRFIGDSRGIPDDVLMDVAKQIGCDVPFFLSQKNAAFCTARGDVVEEAWDVPDLGILVFDSGIPVSTAEAYGGVNLSECGDSWEMTEKLRAMLCDISRPELEKLVHNDFEQAFFREHPKLLGKGHLCGSGGWMWKFSE